MLNGINVAKFEAAKNNETFDLTEYLKGDIVFNKLGQGPKDTFETSAGAQIEREAGKATAKNEVLLAQAADRLADVGEPILKSTNLAIEKTGEAVDLMKNFFENGLSGTLDNWWQGIKSDIQDMLPWGGGGSPSKTNPIYPNSSK